MNLLALATLYDRDPATGRVILHAMPVMLGVLVCLAVAYRYYSAFLAARVAVLDDTRPTPAHLLNDGQNYHPTSKWVLFGHHFAAISGAGPLIGPVLAIQYGYAPGLLWLVIGVCLAGAVQDMLVLAASVRTDGKSLAEIARRELGPAAAVIASVAILVIVVIALAGLGFVVVKALGGEEVKLPAGTTVLVHSNAANSTDWLRIEPHGSGTGRVVYHFPKGCEIRYPSDPAFHTRPEAFQVAKPVAATVVAAEVRRPGSTAPPLPQLDRDDVAYLRRSPAGGTYMYTPDTVYTLPAGSEQVVPGSSWGTFTIAATIPIALLTGLWMYRLRPGRVVEASLVGGFLVLAATVGGAWVPGSPLERFFSLTRDETIIALVTYGFVAAVLPVWLLLGPRDYLSSFLKIGTVVLLVVSVIVANPPLNAPPVNEVFLNGGPTFPGQIFPFVFICVMCGAISGFHSLVSSGTTPKMVDREGHVRTIGYGAMLTEGLVATVALIAAASLPNDLYYDINVAIDKAPQYQQQLKDVSAKYGGDPLHKAGVDNLSHLDLGSVEERVGGESLRGRTGGAVTLAVGMSVTFERAFHMLGVTGDWLLKYWYHFAIMFEALFILTTIDAGTRIARFLLQETAGRVYAPFARPNWVPGALIASAVVTCSWGALIYTGSIDTIWPMFGIANQILSVLALSLVTTWLVNSGRGKYALVTLLPMLFVITTTLTAASQMVTVRFPLMIAGGRELVSKGSVKEGNAQIITGWLSIGMIVFVVTCVLTLVLWAAAKWAAVWSGVAKPRPAGGGVVPR